MKIRNPMFQHTNAKHETVEVRTQTLRFIRNLFRISRFGFRIFPRDERGMVELRLAVEFGGGRFEFGQRRFLRAVRSGSVPSDGCRLDFCVVENIHLFPIALGADEFDRPRQSAGFLHDHFHLAKPACIAFLLGR